MPLQTSEAETHCWQYKTSDQYQNFGETQTEGIFLVYADSTGIYEQGEKKQISQ